MLYKVAMAYDTKWITFRVVNPLLSAVQGCDGVRHEVDHLHECKPAAVLYKVAMAYGMLGSIDANTGDPQTGWDTDQFLTDPLEATRVGLAIIKNGGLAPGEAVREQIRA